MNQATHIRLAVKEDLDQVKANELTIGGDIVETKIELGEVIVADDDGQVTGILRFSWFWDYLPFISYIWVEEGFRHEHRASKMIEKLEEITAGRNWQKVMTSTQADEKAQNFYRAVGFEDAGGFTMRDQPFELIMIKYLGPKQNKTGIKPEINRPPCA